MFFSPAYVQRYGESFLLGLPGYRVERLSDGGIFYQLSRSLLANNEREAVELRTRVTSYCAAHDVAVTCHAPYILPSWGSCRYPCDYDGESRADRVSQTSIRYHIRA